MSAGRAPPREATREHPGREGGEGARPGVPLASLPRLPADSAAFAREAEGTSRRFPLADRAEGVRALQQLATRARSHPGELGDLAPDPAEAQRLALALDSAYRALARLEALTKYVRDVVYVEEHRASVLLDGAHAEVVRRADARRLRSEDYDHVVRFIAARGAAVLRGRARAKARRAGKATDDRGAAR